MFENCLGIVENQEWEEWWLFELVQVLVIMLPVVTDSIICGRLFFID
jgi:hypothetical protein